MSNSVGAISYEPWLFCGVVHFFLYFWLLKLIRKQTDFFQLCLSIWIVCFSDGRIYYNKRLFRLFTPKNIHSLQAEAISHVAVVFGCEPI